MTQVSVVIPVRDGERYLEEVLAGVARQGDLETLVIDSGSTDRSLEIARSAGVATLEIPREDFGHGRTRNLGAERTSGELICFLTQDATPLEGWRDAYLEAFGLDERVGAAFGPHLPRPETSPMIARELTEFFRGLSPDRRPAVHRRGDTAFLSNVNACYARACWEEIRFRDLPYAEDQAFGRDLLAAGWTKVFHPRAAVLHAHDYGTVEFMRRYFDEYRGLRDATGHVEPFSLRSSLAEVRAQVAADRRWMLEQGLDRRSRTAWTGRAVLHHSGRKVFAALGSRAPALPRSVQRRISLERQGDGRPATDDGGPAAAGPVSSGADAHAYASIARLSAGGPARLSDPVPGMATADSLHVAVVVPPFRRGSGGHGTIFEIVAGLEGMGHTCSIWLDDPEGQQAAEWPAVVRQSIVEHFAPVKAPLYKGFGQWYGADVAVATGWQTVHSTMLLDSCRARAYLVNDHEPEFYPTSAEAKFAEETYRLGLYCIAASPWLRDLLADRYGARASDFQLGVDHDAYRPRPVERRRDTVVFYARSVTPRRAVPVGILALEEMQRRRPGLRVLLFGDDRPVAAPFPCEHLGIVSPERLASVYSEATVGLCLSMTNFSRIPKEMLACGLPCVELEGVSAESVFGDDTPLELAAFDPLAIAEAIERLLSDRELWSERSLAGRRSVADHTWEVAARQVEAGLRNALRERESD